MGGRNCESPHCAPSQARVLIGTRFQRDVTVWTFDAVQLQRRGGDGADCARRLRMNTDLAGKNVAE